MRKDIIILLFLFTILPIYSFAGNEYEQFLNKVDRYPFIVVNKQFLTLSLLDENGNPLKEYGIACGRNLGNKQVKGDNKTPEGSFHICQILNSSYLSHDFNDGKGSIPGAYGPWFLRLDVPEFNSIGIHGTHLPESIGTRTTDGCIRMENEDLIELKSLITKGTPVLILPDPILNPDWQDSALSSFVSQDTEIDYYICYDPSDFAAADSIYKILSSAGKTCYFDRDGLDGGLNHPAVLAAAIYKCKQFLLVYSDNAYQSAYVNSTFSFAITRKKTEDLLLSVIDESDPPSTWMSATMPLILPNPTSSHIELKDSYSNVNNSNYLRFGIAVLLIVCIFFLIHHQNRNTSI